MITAYKHSNQMNEIIETPIDQQPLWINVVEPDREEIEYLMDHYNLPEDFIRDPLDSEESARIEYDEDTGYSLIIDLPLINSTNRSVLSFITIPLGIVIGNGIVMTICDAENEFLENFSRQDNINLKFHSRFALEILTTIANHYNRNLRLLNKSRIRIERELKIILQINNFSN